MIARLSYGVSLKVCDVLPPLQKLVNSINYPGEVIHIKSKLQELEAEFKAKFLVNVSFPTITKKMKSQKGIYRGSFLKSKFLGIYSFLYHNINNLRKLY